MMSINVLGFFTPLLRQIEYDMFAHKLGIKFERKICPLLLMWVPLASAMFFQDLCKLPKSVGLYCSTLRKCGHHM